MAFTAYCHCIIPCYKGVLINFIKFTLFLLLLNNEKYYEQVQWLHHCPAVNLQVVASNLAHIYVWVCYFI